jgi:hypothetical protein
VQFTVRRTFFLLKNQLSAFSYQLSAFPYSGADEPVGLEPLLLGPQQLTPLTCCGYVAEIS